MAGRARRRVTERVTAIGFAFAAAARPVASRTLRDKTKSPLSDDPDRRLRAEWRRACRGRFEARSCNRWVTTRLVPAFPSRGVASPFEPVPGF